MTGMAHSSSLRVGLVTGGLGTYWLQFPDLLAQIQLSSSYVADRLRGLGADVRDEGVISDPFDAVAVAERLHNARSDVLIIFVGTYLTAGQVVAIARNLKVPVLLLELQPTASLNHSNVRTQDFLRYAGVAGLPELCNVLSRCDITHDVIVGYLRDDAVWSRVGIWIRAARILPALRTSRFGLMGHLYPGMLDIATSLTSLVRDLGITVDIIEVEELNIATESATDEDVTQILDRVHSDFALAPDVDLEHLQLQARVAAGLNLLMSNHSLAGLAYFFFGQGTDAHERLAGAMSIAGSFQLTDGRPVGTEFDIRAVVAMSMLNTLDVTTMFTELYSVNYRDGVIEVGHDGATNLSMVERAYLKPLDVFHGKAGRGNAIESHATPGPVTFLSLAELGDGSLRLVASEGEVVAGPVMSIGNTVSRVEFGPDPGRFVEHWSMSGSGHHFAMGRGHVAREVQTMAGLLGLDYTEIST